MDDSQVSATDITVLFDRTRLRIARELRGYTQVQLARELGGAVTSASLSQFENGHSRPSAATLRRLAVALRVPIKFFAAPARPGLTEPIDGYFRSLRSAAPRDRLRALAYVQLARELALELEKLVRLPELTLLTLPRPAPAEFSTATIETIARDVRMRWGVPPGPADDVIRAIERNGIITTRFRTNLQKVDAFCVAFPDRPIIALGADKGWRDRSRFDAAHELGHLVMHSPDQIGSKIIERQADQFAAAFLMPQSDIQDELPATADWAKLAELKQRWQVSIASLLVRAKTLGVMSDQTYSQAWKTLSVRGWRKNEPSPLGEPEQPILLRKAIGVAQQNGHQFHAIVERAGLPVEDVEMILGDDIELRPAVEL